MSKIGKSSDYQELNTAERAEIIQDYVSALLKLTSAPDTPHISLVGAQPGAGKSKAADIVKSELKEKGGHIHVDADIMRTRIPVPEGTIYSSAQTQADAGRLAVGVRTAAKENGRNILEEGTFRNKNDVSEYIRQAHQSSYTIEMLAVSTSREESIAGIFKRYEDQYASGNPQPRFVGETFHDMAMAGFKETLIACESEFDRVRVTNRLGEILYDSQNKHENHQGTAIEAVEAYQKITPERLKQVAQAWDVIKIQADGRGRENEPVPDYFEKIEEHQSRTNERIEKIYQQERVVVNSNGSALQRKSGDVWNEIEKIPASGMKAGVHMLGTAKPAENGKTYDGEIIYKDAVSVFQKTPQGLIRHKNVQSSKKNIVSLGDRVSIGQKVSICQDNNQLVVGASSLDTKRSIKRSP